MNDKKLAKYLFLLLLLPLIMAYCSGDRFRYPCQDPDNWDKEICKMPRCDVTRTCPDHIFKGQRDPRLGPPKESQNVLEEQKTKPASCQQQQGVNCGK
jgi:hypothetical protein